MHQVTLGMIGGGTVGGGVYKALHTGGVSLLASRAGVRVRLKRIAVKAFDEPRKVEIPEKLLTTSWREVVEDPEVQIVVELAGGTTVAREMALAALRLGKPVVTANKALLSAHGEELFAAAREHGANLYYEASVAGGIPIIKALREGFIGNRIESIYGIVNGTCNYILSRMEAEGADFEEVLAEAQRLGYAEADPTLDVDGWDSQHKIGILASLAHGFWVRPEHIHVEGIRGIAQQDIRFARQLGYSIKLLGVVKRLRPKRRPDGSPAGTIQVAVYPALVPRQHVLASVSDSFNAVFVRGNVVGETLFYGRGAGQDPTASAVLADIADAALDLKHGVPDRVPAFRPHEQNGSVRPLGECVSRYYVRLTVTDRPGVLARVAAILGEARIGISSVMQPEGHEGRTVPLILMIHDAPNSAMQEALDRIRKLKVVHGPAVMYRVEDFEGGKD
ncbi:MAG: homoserine dehydrogenase [Verrucomicrobia bacterium]|nr:MAG: homoserine dehydrogenase [Verrucomicrobiota bacterium]